MIKKLHIKEDVEIEVKNTGVLEVPENKNVDELPIKHFVALANKKGLSTVTKALNNLQVWNKNKDPKLSKWAGDMIDKVTKRVENKKNESYENIHSYDYAERDTIANNIADWVFEGDIDSNLCELEDLIGPLDMEDYEAPETLVDRLMTFDLDTLLYVESELNVQGIDESTHLEESNQDEIDYRLECADYAMYKVVTNHTGIELVSDNTNGKYEVTYNGLMVTVEFNLDGIAKYEYTINGEGPYCHDSYEYITNDIRDYVDEIMDEEDDIDESCTLTEFSSNFEGTEFGEVEFYSHILKDYPESMIKNTIQTKCLFPINIYTVDNEWDGNISVAYEVKEEDYDPDEINITIVKLLQDLENSLER